MGRSYPRREAVYNSWRRSPPAYRSAYALLDRVAIHYNETTRAAAQDLEARTQRIEQVTGQAQGKVESLNASLSTQLGLLENGSSKLEAQASDISSITGKTLQQLSAINEKFAVTHEAANNNIQATIAAARRMQHGLHAPEQ